MSPLEERITRLERLEKCWSDDYKDIELEFTDMLTNEPKQILGRLRAIVTERLDKLYAQQARARRAP